jgi:hypothetical protein
VEYSADRVCAQAHPDDFRDEPAPEAVIPDLRRWDEHPRASGAWGASDGVRRDATEDAVHRRRELVDADAEKLAGPAQDVQARDASQSELPPGQLERPVSAAELCIQDAVPSAAQSCAAQAFEALQEVAAQPDAAAAWKSAEQKMPSQMAVGTEASQLLLAEQVPAAEVRQRTAHWAQLA